MAVENKDMDLIGEVKELFNLVLEHQESLDELKFFAKLRNGAILRYEVDRKKYEKKLERANTPKGRNEVLNAVFDVIGAAMAIAMLVILIVTSAFNAGTEHIIAFSLYGVVMAVFFTVSSIFHFLPDTYKSKDYFHKLKDLIKMLLIAATFTPIILVVFSGVFSIIIFGLLWILAIVALMFRNGDTKLSNIVSNITAIAMTWLYMAGLPVVLNTMELNGIIWIVLGSIFYTLWLLGFIFQKIIKPEKTEARFNLENIFCIFGNLFFFWLMFDRIMYLPW